MEEYSKQRSFDGIIRTRESAYPAASSNTCTSQIEHKIMRTSVTTLAKSDA